MVIGPIWITNYIKKYGTKIVIPKEATRIYGFGDAMRRLVEEKELEDSTIEILFEENSELEEIASYAFRGCKIKNDLILPKKLKKIEIYAFAGCCGNVRLDKESEIQECEDCFCFENEEVITIPSSLISTSLYLSGRGKTIIIPKDSKITNISTTKDMDLKTIITPDGTIFCDSNEKCKEFKVTDKRYNMIYSKTMENGEEKKYLVSFNKNDIKKEYEVEVLSSPYTDMKGLVVENDSIWSCDLEKLLEIPDIMYVHLNSDQNMRGDYERFEINNRSGKIYSIEEIREIKEKLTEMISNINEPPKNTIDREKIIYTQIVQQLSERLVYDYQTSDMMDEIDWSKQKREQIDSSQNLKGLLSGQTVCKGFSTIIQAMCQYYGIDCKVLLNSEHAWNLVELDGETYEDDFTWYENDLQTSNLLGMKSFLKGINEDGRREFDELKYHEINDEMTLSRSLPENKRFNLLNTDWKHVVNWEEVNIDREINIPDYLNQIKMLSESKTTICMLAAKKISNQTINGLKSFCQKIKTVFIEKGDIEDER